MMVDPRTLRPAGAPPVPPPDNGLKAAFAEASKLARAGRFAEADLIARRILATDPMHIDAMHLRGSVASLTGNADAAIALLDNVVKLKPGEADAHCELGELLFMNGRLREAEGHFSAAIAAAPKLAAAHFGLGSIYKTLGRLTEAEPEFKTAARLKPGMVAAWADLSSVQSAQGKADAAVKSARQAVKADSKSALAQSRLGTALDRAGNLKGAIAAHNKAVALAPDRADLRIDLARTLSAHGRTEQAIAAYRAIIADDPWNAGAWGGLALLKKFTGPNDPDIAEMRRLAADSDLNDKPRRAIAFALGKAMEACKVYDQAFAHYQQGNRIARKLIIFQTRAWDELVADIKATYTKAALASVPGARPGRAPIFIVGMPRSGTSLTARILTAHPEMAGAGELGAINATAGRLTALDPAGTHRAALPHLTAARLGEWADAYLSETAIYAQKSERVVDKMPANFLHIGLIRMLFPNAVIIHCRRNPADTSLSMFKNLFGPGNVPYSYDLDELAHVYRHYLDLMAHWDEVMPGVIYHTDYDLLVGDPGAAARDLLAHCGLDWDDAVLKSHELDQPMHTASMAQVRQPINTASRGVAARYGKAARPLFEALKRAGVEAGQ